MALVQHPAPLQHVSTGSTARNLEASTTSLKIDVRSWHAVGKVQFGNRVLEQLELGDILAVTDGRQVDLDISVN